MNILVAIIRSAVQLGLSKLLEIAFFRDVFTWFVDEVGIDMTEESIVTWATGVLFVAIVALVNWAGKHWAWVNRIFSLGTSMSPALYDQGGRPDTQIDMGGENVPALDNGAVSVSLIFVVAALILAILAVLELVGGPLLGLAVIALAIAHLVP